MPNWSDVLTEVQRFALDHSNQARAALDLVRRRYLKDLAAYTDRNVIAYYSGFLSKPGINSGITDEDKNGFMMAVHNLDSGDSGEAEH